MQQWIVDEKHVQQKRKWLVITFIGWDDTISLLKPVTADIGVLGFHSILLLTWARFSFWHDFCVGLPLKILVFYNFWVDLQLEILFFDIIELTGSSKFCFFVRFLSWSRARNSWFLSYDAGIWVLNMLKYAFVSTYFIQADDRWSVKAECWFLGRCWG